MRWKKLSPYAIRSECGRWQISRAEQPDHQTFTVWRRDTGSGRCIMVAVYRQSSSAKAYAAKQDQHIGGADS